MAVREMVNSGTLSPAQEKTYVHVPFTVPENAVRLEVTLRYSARISSDPTITGGNTIDLGVFDARGIDFLQAGFRGWSGSERETFFITEKEATPGYLAGALMPGEWHVLLGLYKIAPQGCDYHMTARVTTQEGYISSIWPVAEGDLPVSSPPASFAPWLRGELHSHTWHSDGGLSPDDLLQQARSAQLDFLAVSDHNTTSAQRELENMQSPGLILVRGVEVTTFRGHFNVWGIPDWVDFRVTQPAEMQAALQYAIDHGGLTSCAHPKPLGPDWDFRDVTNFHCVEVWNGPWNGFNELSLGYWVSLLAQGMRKPAVGGSDYHRDGESAGGRPREIGTPTNWVYAPNAQSAAEILSAVSRGHVSLSEAPEGPLLALWGGDGATVLQGDVWIGHTSMPLPLRLVCKGGQGARLRLLDQSGVRWQETVAQEDAVMECVVDVSNSLYIRAELRDGDDRMLALTNPIYLQNA